MLVVIFCAASLLFAAFALYMRAAGYQPGRVALLSLAGVACCYLCLCQIETQAVLVAGYLWGPGTLLSAGCALTIGLPYALRWIGRLQPTGRRHRSLYAADLAAPPLLQQAGQSATLSLLAPVMRAYAECDDVAWQYLPGDVVGLTLVDAGLCVQFSPDSISATLPSSASGKAKAAEPAAGRPMRRMAEKV